MLQIKSAWAIPARAVLLVLSLAAPAAADPPFKHKPHETISCLTCHERKDGHGAVKITIAADCTGCHHARQNLKACGSCHSERELAAPLKRTLTFQTSTAKAAPTRTVSFAHTQHNATECNACHAPAAGMRVLRACTSCHSEHHQEARDCTSCHADAGKVAAHDAGPHLGCGGSGCHQDEVTARLRSQRNVCLACHDNMADHQPGGECASCHMIPREKR